MPRTGYRTITVREDVYEKLKKIASSKGMSIAELVESLVHNGEESNQYVVDYTRCLGMDLGTRIRLRDNKPIVELDETDHIMFKCSTCETELTLASISIECKGYGTVRMMLFCPDCGRVYYRKFYAPGALHTIDEIPRAIAKVYNVDLQKKMKEILEVILASLALDHYAINIDRDGRYMYIGLRVLESNPVAKTLNSLGVEKEFLEKYSLITGDDRVRIIGDSLCVDLDVFAEVFRSVIESIVEKIEAHQVLSDGTRLYEFVTDYELKPSQLLRYSYGYMFNWVGAMLRGIDVLRSIKYIMEMVFDCIGCMKTFYDDVRRATSFSNILDSVKRNSMACSSYYKALIKVVSLSKVLPVFVPTKRGNKVIIVIS